MSDQEAERGDVGESGNYESRIIAAFGVPCAALGGPVAPFRSPWRNFISQSSGWDRRADNELYSFLAWADELPESRQDAFVNSWLDRWGFNRYREPERVICVGYRGWDRIADWWERLWT